MVKYGTRILWFIKLLKISKDIGDQTYGGLVTSLVDEKVATSDVILNS